MILTEEEAKSRACQESFAASGNPTITMRQCIASGCMAWSWKGWNNNGGNEPANFLPSNPTAEHPDYKRYGFCGKAGP